MRQFSILIALLLCVSLLLCACSKNKEDADELSAEESANLENLIDEAGRITTIQTRLEKYYEIIELDPRNIDARLNIAKCHIYLKNYDMAAHALDFAVKADPANNKIYELYAQISKYSEDLSYAYTAIDLAQQNHNEAFLSMRPEAPTLKIAEGTYEKRVNFEIDTDSTNGDIYVTVANDGDLSYDFTIKYTGPIALLRGNNTVSVYAVKNGMPSETVMAKYFVDYEPTEVKFQEPAIEKIVRLALNKSSGPITDVDCESIDRLNWSDLRDTVSSDAAYKSIKIQSLEDLKYFPRLTRLDLEYQDKISDFSSLSNCTLISTLDFENCYLTSASFAKYVPTVQHLYLYNDKAIWNIYLDDIAELEKLTNLQSLDIRNNNLGHQTGEMSWNIYHLTDVVKNNPKLTRLYFESDQIPMYEWHVLEELDGLTQLLFWGVDNANYDVIANLKSLERLYVYNGSYDKWSPSKGVWETEAKPLTYLVNLSNLKYLVIQNLDDPTQLTYLADIQNLEYLRLLNSDVTLDMDFMNALQQALPNCQIVTE